MLYLVEDLEKSRIRVILHLVLGFDVGQGVHDHQRELADVVHALSANEQHTARRLKVVGVPERITGVVVCGKMVGEKKGDSRGGNSVSEQADDKCSKLVDDEVSWRELVDVYHCDV